MSRSLTGVGRLAPVLLVLAFCAGCVITSDDNAPPPESPREAAELNVQLGANYLRQGKLELAKQKLDKALEQDPQLASANTYSALVYDQLGETERADQLYRRALRLAPRDSSTLNLYGAFLCGQGRMEEAERYFVSATKDPLYRTPWAALTNAGVCLLRIPDPDRAEAYFRQALNSNPKYPDALWQMARLSFERKVYLPARAFVERYLDAAGPSPESLWMGVRIERELGDENAARGYAQRLREQFPGSVETRLLIESERDGGAS